MWPKAKTAIFEKKGNRMKSLLLISFLLTLSVNAFAKLICVTDNWNGEEKVYLEVTDTKKPNEFYISIELVDRGQKFGIIAQGVMTANKLNLAMRDDQSYPLATLRGTAVFAGMFDKINFDYSDFGIHKLKMTCVMPN